LKIKIAYQQSEEKQAEEIARLINSECEADNLIKETRSDRHAPFFHIYLSVTSLLKPRK
jgi:hypothetical protein